MTSENHRSSRSSSVWNRSKTPNPEPQTAPVAAEFADGVMDAMKRLPLGSEIRRVTPPSLEQRSVHVVQWFSGTAWFFLDRCPNTKQAWFAKQVVFHLLFQRV